MIGENMDTLDTFDVMGKWLGIPQDSEAYQSLKSNFASMAPVMESIVEDVKREVSFFPAKGIMYKDKNKDKFYMYDKEVKSIGFYENDDEDSIYIWKDLSSNEKVAIELEYFHDNFVEVNTKDVLKEV